MVPHLRGLEIGVLGRSPVCRLSTCIPYRFAALPRAEIKQVPANVETAAAPLQRHQDLQVVEAIDHFLGDLHEPSTLARGFFV